MGLPSATFASTNKPLLIAISGGSGSGKTTVVNELLHLFPEQITNLSQDSYYKDLSHLPMIEREKVNFDAPDSIDFNLLIEHLRQLAKGQSIQRPNYDFTTHTRTKQVDTVNPNKIIVVEGILLFAIPELRELFDIRVFMDVSSEDRLIRRINRDMAERGRSLQSVKTQYLTTVAPMYLKHVAPSKKYAHLIIPAGGKNEVALDFLFTKLAAYLKTA
ncbi:MAG: uridine kinase [bacterium]|nr:uridine kinase [bacterium]